MDEQEIIREIQALRQEGFCLKEITEILHDEGYRKLSHGDVARLYYKIKEDENE